jgi:hypothetical protein
VVGVLNARSNPDNWAKGRGKIDCYKGQSVFHFIFYRVLPPIILAPLVVKVNSSHLCPGVSDEEFVSLAVLSGDEMHVFAACPVEKLRMWLSPVTASCIG